MGISDDDRGKAGRVTRRNVIGAAAAATGIAAFAASKVVRNTGDEPDSTATSDPDSPSPTSAAPDSRHTPTEITSEVTENGFDISIPGVQIWAPAGVALPGTPVMVRLSDDPVPDGIYAFTNTVGETVQIVLGDNEQPKLPVTIKFDLAGTDLAGTHSDETPLLVISRSDGEEIMQLIEGSWNAEAESLTVITEHLSWYNPFSWDIRKFIDNLLLDLLNLRFTRPPNPYNELTLGSTTYSINRPTSDVVLPVLGEQDNQIILKLHSNSPVPWQVQTRPANIGSVSGEYKDLGPGVARYYQGLYGLIGSQRTAVMPGNVATFQYQPTNPPTQVGLKIEPGLFLLTTLLWAFESILSILATSEKAKALLETFESFSCVTEIINTSHQIEDDRNFAGVVRSALSCIGSLIQQNAIRIGNAFFIKTIAGLVGMVIGGAGIIASAIAGFIYTVTGNSVVNFSITSTSESTETPVARESRPPVDGTWLMPGGNPARTGEMPGVGPRFDLPVVKRWKWAANTQLGQWTAPVVNNGVLYHSPKEHSGFGAYDFTTGSKRWGVLPDWHVEHQIIARDRIFAAAWRMSTFSRDGQPERDRLFAFEAETGEQIWSTQVDDMRPRTLVADDVRVYCRTDESAVVAVSAIDGSMVWTRELPPDLPRPTRQGINADELSSLTLDGGILFVGSKVGVLLALDAETGSEIWRFTIPEGAEGTTSEVIVSDSTLYLSDYQGTLYALDPGSGTEHWRTDANTMHKLSAAHAGRLFGSHTSRGAIAIDAKSGASLWSFPTSPGDAVVSSVNSTTVLVVGTGSWEVLWRIYGLNTSNGEELWSFESPPRRYDPVFIGEYMMMNGLLGYVVGNLPASVLTHDVTLRAAPSEGAIGREHLTTGTRIDQIQSRREVNGKLWVEVTISDITGWIPIDSLDPDSLPPEGEVEYIYTPE